MIQQHFRSYILYSVICIISASCMQSFIAGTQIRDTNENRQVYNIVMKIREVLEQRDIETLMGMVSTRYFEDNGTSDPRDDYGYLELKEKILSDTLKTAKEFYVNFEMHDIVVSGDHAYAELRYSSRTRIELPSGRVWDTHRDFNRIEFVKEAGMWKIISGL